MSYSIGISAYFHESSVSVFHLGKLIGFAREEYFSRVKGDNSFPRLALEFYKDSLRLSDNDIDFVCFYEKNTENPPVIHPVSPGFHPGFHHSFHQGFHQGNIHQADYQEVHSDCPGLSWARSLVNSLVDSVVDFWWIPWWIPWWISWIPWWIPWWILWWIPWWISGDFFRCFFSEFLR